MSAVEDLPNGLQIDLGHKLWTIRRMEAGQIRLEICEGFTAGTGWLGQTIELAGHRYRVQRANRRSLYLTKHINEGI